MAVAKNHGGGGLGIPVGFKELKELELGEVTGLGESRNCFWRGQRNRTGGMNGTG